jgi:hypothetical protein
MQHSDTDTDKNVNIRSYKTVFDVVGYTISGGLAVAGAIAKWRAHKRRSKNGGFLSILSDESTSVHPECNDRIKTCERGIENIRGEIQASSALQLQMHRENQSRQDEVSKRQDELVRRVDQLTRSQEQYTRRVMLKFRTLIARLGEDKP